MILRKPYAFFIKHFRFFHFVMLVFLGLIVYRTNIVRTFFNEYLNAVAYIIPENIASSMFTNTTYIWGVIVILFSIIVFVVMNKKEKPVLFYGLNILLVISTLVFLTYSRVIVYRLQSELVSVQILRALRDIGNILFMVQAVFLIVTFVRAIGFDIKKFNFSKDLQELNISSEDYEEYEVQFNFDKNEFKRNIRKNIREFKYFLLENKKMIIIFTSIFIMVVFSFIYFNFWKFSKKVNTNSFFTTSDFSMKITNSYITQKNYKQKNISDNYLVAVLLETKKSNNKINTSKTQLRVGKGIYYPIDSKYKEALSDLGTVYDSQKLENDSNKFVLIYEIPVALKDKEMSFVYLDNYTRTLFGEKYTEYKINLKPTNIDENITTKETELENNLEFNNDFIKGNLTIMNYELNDLFTKKYNTCITKTECYDLNEYLQPSFTGYEDKTILRINATLNYDESSSINDDLISLISKYGQIVYTIGDKTYTSNNITATNFEIKKDNQNYYMEVSKKLKDATKIDIVLNIRNNKYVYNLKK